jgi:hypothetical protein
MKPKPTEKGTSRPIPGNWQQMNRKQRREMTRKIQSGDIRLEVVHADAAGIDIGNETHYVAVPPTRDSQPVRRFGCTTAELKEMAVWLKQCAIRTVAIAYASHCTSLGRCETFSTNFSLFDNLTPLAFRGGLAPGSS